MQANRNRYLAPRNCTHHRRKWVYRGSIPVELARRPLNVIREMHRKVPRTTKVSNRKLQRLPLPRAKAIADSVLVTALFITEVPKIKRGICTDINFKRPSTCCQKSFAGFIADGHHSRLPSENSGELSRNGMPERSDTLPPPNRLTRCAAS